MSSPQENTPASRSTPSDMNDVPTPEEEQEVIMQQASDGSPTGAPVEDNNRTQTPSIRALGKAPASACTRARVSRRSTIPRGSSGIQRSTIPRTGHRNPRDIPLEQLDPWLAEHLASQAQIQESSRPTQDERSRELIAELRQERDELRDILVDAMSEVTGGLREEEHVFDERLSRLLLLLNPDSFAPRPSTEHTVVVDPVELLRLYEGSKRIISRMQHDLEVIHETQRATASHNHELRAYNNQLRGEVADLQAQLSYATQTLTTQIREQIDSARSRASSETRLREVVDEQSKAIQKFTQEKKANTKRIQKLEQRLNAGHAPLPSNTSNPNAIPKKTKAQKRRERVEQERLSASTQAPAPIPTPAPAPAPAPTPAPTPAPAPATTPVSPISANTRSAVKDEEMRDVTVIDDDNVVEQDIPDLALSKGIARDVLEQLKRYMRKRTGRKNLLSFLNNGTKNKCFCIHEVISKGGNASAQLFPSTKVCAVNGTACDFLVEVIETPSGNKLRAFSPWGSYEPID